MLQLRSDWACSIEKTASTMVKALRLQRFFVVPEAVQICVNLTHTNSVI
jgi:hypothetical protein